MMKSTGYQLVEPVVTAGVLSLPLVIADALIGAAWWQTAVDDEPTADALADADALAAEIDADADIDALLSLSDDELDALDAGEQLTLIDSFPDGLGWDWPGTDWEQSLPWVDAESGE